VRIRDRYPVCGTETLTEAATPVNGSGVLALVPLNAELGRVTSLERQEEHQVDWPRPVAYRYRHVLSGMKVGRRVEQGTDCE